MPITKKETRDFGSESHLEKKRMYIISNVIHMVVSCLYKPLIKVNCTTENARKKLVRRGIVFELVAFLIIIEVR